MFLLPKAAAAAVAEKGSSCLASSDPSSMLTVQLIVLYFGFLMISESRHVASKSYFTFICKELCLIEKLLSPF